VLDDECRRRGRTITTVPLERAILRDRIGRAELIDRVLDAYSREDCDGLFLSAVTCRGVRMPVPELVAAVSRTRAPGFVAVDAAQAVNHTLLGPLRGHCDFLIAGCHKWLRAYHPMGLGYCGRAATDGVLADARREVTEQGQLDDPLLRFTWQLENDCCDRFSETVNLAPLFTASAAIARLWHARRGRTEQFTRQLDNTDRVAALTDATAWQPLRPDASLRSGILLLQAKSEEARTAPPDVLRERFRRKGIAVSIYEGGIVRQSLLSPPLHTRQLVQLRSAFDAVS